MGFDCKFCRHAKNEFRLAVLTGFDDLASGAISIDREPGYRVAQQEPGVLGAMFSFEVRISRAAGAHQSGIDRGHVDVVFQELGAKAFRKPSESEFADAIRQKMGNTYLAAD